MQLTLIGSNSQKHTEGERLEVNSVNVRQTEGGGRFYWWICLQNWLDWRRRVCTDVTTSCSFRCWVRRDGRKVSRRSTEGQLMVSRKVNWRSAKGQLKVNWRSAQGDSEDRKQDSDPRVRTDWPGFSGTTEKVKNHEDWLIWYDWLLLTNQRKMRFLKSN